MTYIRGRDCTTRAYRVCHPVRYKRCVNRCAVTFDMPKRKRLALSELRSIARERRKADIDVIQAVVVKEVQKERHIYVFPERQALWCYLIRERSPAFREKNIHW